MKKIKQEQAKVLEDIIGENWKKIPIVNEIEWEKSGVIIQDGDIIGLGLYNIKLTTLPESIGNLKSLEEFFLGDNPLTTLPESIGNLKSLVFLVLDGNQLTTLPESIGNLRSLKTLNLESNRLTTLPESIGNLKSLEEFFLGGNPLTTLPESIGNLKSLEELLSGGNQLTILPESIGNLTSLEFLVLDDNQLTALPESIGNLTSLKGLFLFNNQLTTLPESIGNLTSLEELTLGGNPFNQEFKKIFEMANGDLYKTSFFDLRACSNITRKIFLFNKTIKEKYKEEKFVIEKLIQEAKFSEVVLKLKNIKKSAQENNFREIFSWALKNLKICNEPIIKKSVLDLGTKFGRLQIAEISEVCGVDDVQLIVDVVKEMIDNKEIYAQYFSSTKSVAFNQQANIDEIDKLMASYKDWEDKEVGKK